MDGGELPIISEPVLNWSNGSMVSIVVFDCKAREKIVDIIILVNKLIL